VTGFSWILHKISTVFFAGFLALVLTLVASPKHAAAQESYWIQVESQNNIRDTRLRAQSFAAQFPDTHAFLTTSGWYAVVIGPYPRNQAQALLSSLKAQNRIPADSLLSNGREHVKQLWPLMANTTIAPATGIVVTQEPTTPAPEPEPAPKVVVQEPLAVNENTATAEETPLAPPANIAATEPVDLPIITDPSLPIADENLSATRALERGWSRDQKKQYQTYMVWTGDYEAAIDGDYGRGTRKAIKQFQTREGFEDTGYLTEAQLVILKQRYDDTIAMLGIDTLRDLDAGIEIKYPSKLVEFGRFEPPFVHYKPKGTSKARMMLISQQGGRDTLKSLYDIMETLDYIPPEGYRKRRRDWFVLSGRNDSMVSYTYAKTANGEVKGFTLVWPPEMDSVMRPLATAMYNSFTPLDGYVLDENLGIGNGGEQSVDLSTGLDTAQPARAATGFFISADGVVLTHVANVDACKRVTIGDGVDVALVARNTKLGLAVLKPTAAFTPRSFALFSSEVPKMGTEITVAGFSFPDVMDVATLNYGTLTATSGMLGNPENLRVSAFLESGDAGGPVLDNRGAVIGMELLKSPENANLPEYVNFALKAATITQLLDRYKLTYGRSTAIDVVAPEDLAFMAGDFTVKVSCWK